MNLPHLQGRMSQGNKKDQKKVENSGVIPLRPVHFFDRSLNGLRFLYLPGRAAPGLN